MRFGRSCRGARRSIEETLIIAGKKAMLIRVILDTCTVRSLVHRDDPTLDLQAIRTCKDQLRLSLPGSAFAELLEQLCSSTRGISFSNWQLAAVHLDTILDKRWPCFPSGKELSALTKVQALSLDVPLEQCYMQACWRLLKSATSVADLQNPMLFQSPDGQSYEIKLDLETLANVNSGERQSWIDYIEKMRKMLVSVDLGRHDEERVYDMIRSDHGSQPDDSPEMSRKLDSVNRMIAKLVVLSLQANQPYNPNTQRRRGDAFDIKLLFHVPLPAVICTADQRFVNRLRDTKALGSQQVVTVDEFNRHVRNGTLSSQVFSFRTPEKQQKEWQEAAYFRWINRNRPTGDDWADWFAAEPVA
jgi:hypothetical protein